MRDGVWEGLEGLEGDMGCSEAGPGGGRTSPVRVEGPSEEAEGVWRKCVLF